MKPFRLSSPEIGALNKILLVIKHSNPRLFSYNRLHHTNSLQSFLNKQGFSHIRSNLAVSLVLFIQWVDVGLQMVAVATNSNTQIHSCYPACCSLFILFHTIFNVLTKSVIQFWIAWNLNDFEKVFFCFCIYVFFNV